MVLSRVVNICEEGSGGGMIFPVEGSPEFGWPSSVRGIVYAVSMVYWFIGVAIVADLFMASIDMITSRRCRWKVNGKLRTFKVWNETIATLTLMALGSSAPEIFLAMIDIVKKDFHFGGLGPSTIVGSAAFNLLVIVAVCILVIPEDEVRVVKKLPVLYVTAFFSVFAYVWMALTLSVITPRVVDIWEALATLMFLPVLVYISYKTDGGYFDGFMARVGVLPVADEDSKPEAGVLAFSTDTIKVPGAPQQRLVEVLVSRKKASGPLGPAQCTYKTEHFTAVPGVDFEVLSGELTFKEGERETTLEFAIPAKARRVADVEFFVILQDAEGVNGFDPDDDGGEQEAILTVLVERHGPEASWCRRAIHRHVNWDSFKVSMAEWKDQITSVFYVNGSLEEQKEASKTDWAMHLLSLPWKVLVACLPPVYMAGGWACFCGSLLGIAVLTAAVSDLAELFGCVLNIPDIVTAITFVALGTSMPDLFASLTSAKEDPTADASVVNVTGSNSVNVFLGLGLPWSVATIYWQINGRTPLWEELYPEMLDAFDGAAFIVESQDLGFGVGSFCLLCLLAMTLLHARRKYLGAELGGHFVPKFAAFMTFVSLWVAWVFIVSWRVLIGHSSDPVANVGVIGGMCMIVGMVWGASMFITKTFAMRLELLQDKAQQERELREPEQEPRPEQIQTADTGGTGSMDAEAEDAVVKDAKAQEQVLDIGEEKEVGAIPQMSPDEQFAIPQMSPDEQFGVDDDIASEKAIETLVTWQRRGVAALERARA